jgi:hypothetical protein
MVTHCVLLAGLRLNRLAGTHPSALEPPAGTLLHWLLLLLLNAQHRVFFLLWVQRMLPLLPLAVLLLLLLLRWRGLDALGLLLLAAP